MNKISGGRRGGKSNALLVRRLELAFGSPTDQWKGQCYAVATALVPLTVGGVAVYGHYRGTVAPGSHFAERAHIGFVHHGWVVLPDGTVMDPTRWVFEDVPPYVYVGPPGDTYDRGGNVYRQQRIGPPPGAEDDEERVFAIGGPATALVVGIFGDHALTFDQVRWLAHLPPALMENAGRSLFEQLVAADFGALIPLDNRREVLGDDA